MQYNIKVLPQENDVETDKEITMMFWLPKDAQHFHNKLGYNDCGGLVTENLFALIVQTSSFRLRLESYAGIDLIFLYLV